MNPGEAEAYLASVVSRETRAALARYQELLAAQQHNLVAASTIAEFASRHLADSLQLLRLAPATGAWVDIGSGGGLPGIPIAIARPAPMILIEPRRLRAEFLRSCAEQLGLAHVEVIQASAGSVQMAPASVISARAVASLDRLFEMARGFADERSTWLLLKGRGAQEEVDRAARLWHGDFTMVPSVTQQGSWIVVATNVRAKSGAGRR